MDFSFDMYSLSYIYFNQQYEDMALIFSELIVLIKIYSNVRGKSSIALEMTLSQNAGVPKAT